MALAAPGARAQPESVDPEAGPEAAQFPEKIARAISGYTIRSQLGPVDTPLTLGMANFLLDHPDMCAFLVKRHKLAPYSIERLGPRRSSADDGNGTRGLITLTQRREASRVYFGDGYHQSKMFPTIHATTVILMGIREASGPECRPHVLSDFDVYVRLKNPVLSGFAKVLRPFIKGMVARIFTKAFLVADQVGRLMAKDPEGMAAEAALFPGTTAEDRAELARLLAGLGGVKKDCARGG